MFDAPLRVQVHTLDSVYDRLASIPVDLFVVTLKYRV